MKREEFKKIGLKWDQLNTEYDDYIKKAFDSPDPVSISLDDSKLEKMRNELFELETVWFKVIRGEIPLED